MDRSDIDDDPEEVEINSEGATEREKEECTINPNQMDFYKDNPFASCQSDRMYQTQCLMQSTCLLW